MGRLVVAGLVLAAALVPLGCGSDHGGGPTPTPTPSSTPGETPTPTPLPSPTVAMITIVPSVPSFAGLGVAGSDAGFLVAYGTPAAPSSAIYGVRLTGDGEVLDRAPFLISVEQSGGFLADPSWSAPAVGFDGSSYAVAYAGQGTAEGGIPAAAITAVLVDPQATVGVPTDLAETASIGMCQADVGPPPALAGTPTSSFAALWPLMEGCINVPVIDRLDGALATPQGEALSASEIQGLLPPFDQTPLQTSAASVASSTTTTVAAWTESASDPSAAVVEVALITPDGVERTQLATGVGALTRPAIASDGSDYLVVWQEGSNSIRGGRFRPGNGPLDGPDGFLIAEVPAVVPPHVAYGDGTYLVAFRNIVSSNSQVQTFAVSPAGAVRAITTGARAMLAGDVAVAASGANFLVTYWLGGIEGLLIRP